MNLEVFPTKIEGVKIIKTKPHIDDRGAFYESFNAKDFEAHGLPTTWLQENVTYNHKGVLRGMHMLKKDPQAKIVRCLAGTIWDCWVDLRPDRPTKGKWESVSLGGEHVEAVYVPPGLAHGFFVVSSFALVHYMCSTVYVKEHDGGIRYDDAKVGIEWPFGDYFPPVTSPKDLNLPTMDDYFDSLR